MVQSVTERKDMSALPKEFIKFANQLHFAVKGHLIPEGASDTTVREIYDQYFRRCWGNHETFLDSGAFNKAWSERNKG